MSSTAIAFEEENTSASFLDNPVESLALAYIEYPGRRSSIQRKVNPCDFLSRFKFFTSVLAIDESNKDKEYLSPKLRKSFVRRAAKDFCWSFEGLPIEDQINLANVGAQFVKKYKSILPDRFACSVYKAHDNIFSAPSYPDTATAHAEALRSWVALLSNVGPDSLISYNAAVKAKAHVAKAAVPERLYWGEDLLKQMSEFRTYSIDRSIQLHRHRESVARVLENTLLQAKSPSGAYGCAGRVISGASYLLGRLYPYKQNLPRFEKLTGLIVKMATHSPSQSNTAINQRRCYLKEAFNFFGQQEECTGGSVRKLYRRRLGEVAGHLQELYAKPEVSSSPSKA